MKLEKFFQTLFLKPLNFKSDHIIIFTGVDGAGKTTHSKLLMEELEAKGCSVKYVWGGFFHFFSLPLLAYARGMGYTETYRVGSKQVSCHCFHRSRLLAFLYPITLLIDTFIFNLVFIIPYTLIGKSVICDRFVYDILVHLMVSLNDPEIMYKNCARLYLSLIPCESRVIMLKTSPHLLLKRREDIANDKTLHYKIMLYERIAKIFKIPVINSDKSVICVHQQILDILNGFP